MVAPRVAPSDLLSTDPRLKLVEANIGGRQICGSRFRREASGALNIQKMRLSPGDPLQSTGSGRTWLEADEALVREDLSKIQGNGRVRLGLGELTLEGESFQLLPSEGLLLMSQVVVRSRDPMCRITANRLRAHFRIDDDEDAPIFDRLELLGNIRGRMALPWRQDSRRFELSAGRLVLDWAGQDIRVQIFGGRRSQAELRSHDGLIELRTNEGTLTRSGQELRFQGQLTGTAKVSGSSLFDPSERSHFRVTETQGFALTQSSECPVWWSGESKECALDRLTILGARCGQRLLGEKLTLHDPGFAEA